MARVEYFVIHQLFFFLGSGSKKTVRFPPSAIVMHLSKGPHGQMTTIWLKSEMWRTDSEVR